MLDALRGERIKSFVSPSPHFLHKPSLPFESLLIWVGKYDGTETKKWEIKENFDEKNNSSAFAS